MGRWLCLGRWVGAFPDDFPEEVSSNGTYPPKAVRNQGGLFGRGIVSTLFSIFFYYELCGTCFIAIFMFVSRYLQVRCFERGTRAFQYMSETIRWLVETGAEVNFKLLLIIAVGYKLRVKGEYSVLVKWCVV